jgi:diguanylate cyclase (GGDEF)-like protein
MARSQDEERYSRIEVFEAFGQALTGSLNLAEILRRMAAVVVEKLGYRNCAIVLHHPDRRELEVHTIVGLNYEPMAGARFPDTKGVTGEVVRTGRTAVIPDTRSEPRYISGQPGGESGRSEIAVPINFGGRVIGVLDCESNEPGAFGDYDARLLGTLASAIGSAVHNAGLYTQAQRMIEELESILEVSQLLSSSGTLDVLFRRILEHACRITNSKAGSISLFDPAENLMRLAAVKGLNVMVRPDATWPVREGSITWRLMNKPEPVVVPDIALQAPGGGKAVETAGIAAFVAVPLFSGGHFNGVLFVDDFHPRNYPFEDVRLLAILANTASVAIDGAHLNEKLSSFAFTDALTELPNRRSFEETLDRETKRAIRYNHTLSLVIFDLDYFKKYNDFFGHREGDLALRTISRIIRESIRDTDFPARYGGEEIAVILPESCTEEALALAERTRRAVEKLPHGPSHPLKRKLTISGGVACMPDDTSFREELVTMADQALYHAKRHGRNSVILWRDSRKEARPVIPTKLNLPELGGLDRPNPLL